MWFTKAAIDCPPADCSEHLFARPGPVPTAAPAPSPVTTRASPSSFSAFDLAPGSGRLKWGGSGKLTVTVDPAGNYTLSSEWFQDLDKFKGEASGAAARVK